MTASATAAGPQGVRGRFAGQFRQGVAWNLAALGVIGVSGILLNVLIVSFYGARTLGAFNEVYAIYVITSQLAVGGVHLSVLRSAAAHRDEAGRCATIILAGLAVSALLGVICAAAFAGASGLVGSLMGADEVRVGMLWAAPGLSLFALNKVQLAALNGLGRMRAYAALHSLRFLVMIAAATALATTHAPGSRLAVIFTVAEACVAAGALAVARRHLARPDPGIRRWVRDHTGFGIRSAVGGLLIELNTRVDVLMLGYFTSERLVGIYSFAAMLAEGFFHVLVVLRNNVDPPLVRLIVARDVAGIRHLARRVKLGSVALMAGGAAAAVAGYPLFVRVATHDPEMMQSWRLFSILVSGLVVASVYMPFLGVLLAGGRPGLNSLLITTVVTVNVVGNLLLIPPLGATGAALATAVAINVWAYSLPVLSRSALGVPI